MIRGVCPCHVSLTPKWSAIATLNYPAHPHESSKEINIFRLNKLNRAAKKKKKGVRWRVRVGERWEEKGKKPCSIV
jgi:hypothetical protein